MEIHRSMKVKKLLSSFQPLPAPSSLVSRAQLNVSQLPMPPPTRENQPNHTVRFLPPELRYVHAAPAGPASIQNAHEARYVHAVLGPTPVLRAHAPVGSSSVQIAQDTRYVHAALQGSAPVQSTQAWQQYYNRPAADVAQVHMTLGHQSLPAMGNRYYVPDSQRPYFTESSSRAVHQPYARWFFIPKAFNIYFILVYFGPGRGEDLMVLECGLELFRFSS